MGSFSVTFLGSALEVGRSAILASTDKKLMLDYGLKLFATEEVDYKPTEYDGHLDLAILSHAHMDHSGNAPALFMKNNAPIVSTPPTKALCEILWEDSLKIGTFQTYSKNNMKSAVKNFMTVPYGKSIFTGSTKFSLHDAGHIAGSSVVALEYAGKKLVYSGDIKLQDTKMHHGTAFAEKADALIIESTYAQREHPPRQELESKLQDSAKKTVDDGGIMLLPSFAIGRSQELVSILSELPDDIDIYLDGMGKLAALAALEFPEYIRDFEHFQGALNRVHFVNSQLEREQAVARPGIIIATAGMLQGGPSLFYLMNLNPNSKIAMTGYSMEGTNGHSLVNEGTVVIDEKKIKIDLPVEYMDFSAHAGRSELFEFIERIGPSQIICNHGDSCMAFAEELKGKGYDAVAPAIGQTVEIK